MGAALAAVAAAPGIVARTDPAAPGKAAPLGCSERSAAVLAGSNCVSSSKFNMLNTLVKD
ncbi:hypothetical protein [Comamonas serinivorans]|uniref:hypothetical protein n=1 Tax=Comamonas serinivorans TaxID=1082851 RepID=UPI0012FA9611|nr:hypothetical protein [Comamonas serinivorans]